LDIPSLSVIAQIQYIGEYQLGIRVRYFHIVCYLHLFCFIWKDLWEILFPHCKEEGIINK